MPLPWGYGAGSVWEELQRFPQQYYILSRYFVCIEASALRVHFVNVFIVYFCLFQYLVQEESFSVLINVCHLLLSVMDIRIVKITLTKTIVMIKV